MEGIGPRKCRCLEEGDCGGHMLTKVCKPCASPGILCRMSGREHIFMCIQFPLMRGDAFSIKEEITP